MKRMIFVLAIVSTVFLGLDSGAQSPKTLKVLETPYFPLNVGTKWLYKAGDQKVVIRVDDLDFKERRVDGKKNGLDEKIVEKVPCYRLEVIGGTTQDLETRRKDSAAIRALTEHVAVLEDGIYRFSGAGKDFNPPLRFFKLPLNDGESWTCDSTTDGTTLKGGFKAKRDRVSVPAGSYDTMAVTGAIQIGPKKMDVQYWFAPNVGIVKQYVKIGDYEVTLELEKFEPAAK